MTKKELLKQIDDLDLRDDDPIVIEIDNRNEDYSHHWIDSYDFTIGTIKLDEDYTEVRFKVMPN